MADTSTHAATLGQAVRLDAWRSVFEKTNRIISERPVTVQIADHTTMPGGMSDVPAWTNGEAITFNGPQIERTLARKDPVSAVLSMKGLNYHELSHVLYTPRMGDELPRLVLKKVNDTGDPSYWYAFNALEDQRIETWFTSVFGASRRYFEATVMNWIVKEATSEAAPLIYGRKYLSSTVRVGAGNVFVQKHGQSLYDDFKAVIDQYLLVTFPAQSSKAYTLIIEYHALMEQVAKNSPLPNLPIPDNGCQAGAHGTPGRSDPSAVRAGRLSKRVQQDAVEAAQGAIDQAAANDKAAQEASPAPQQDAPGAGDQGSDTNAAEAAAEAADNAPAGGAPAPVPAGGTTGDTGSGKGKSKSESTSDQDGGQGAGMSGADTEVVPSTMRDLMQAASEALDEIQADPTILRDVEQTLDAVKANVAAGHLDAQGELAGSGALTDASDGQKVASRRIFHILSKIRSDLEPQKLREQQMGRINVRKYMSRRPGQVEIFDQWDEGSEDEASVEAVILIDCSGSMRGSMEDACGAAWALKRAFDKLSIRSTALVYNGYHRVLYQPSTKAKAGVPVVSSGGGTDPTSAYEQAMRIFVKSQAHNKILVNMTDGQWSNTEEHYAKILRTLHSEGVSTMVLGLQGAVSTYGKHSHKIGHDITNVTELPKAVTKWVADIMGNVRH